MSFMAELQDVMKEFISKQKREYRIKRVNGCSFSRHSQSVYLMYLLPVNYEGLMVKMDDTSDVTSDLGQKLRRLRKSKRMTQKQVADRLNLRPSTVSSYERNDKTPSLFTLKKLAYLFNVSTDFLLGMESRYQINTDGLTSRQIFLIEETIESFRRKNPR